MQWNCQEADVRLSFGISMLSCLFIQRISMRIERTYLSAPLFIAAVTLLMVNDLYLKSAYPGVVTGKLSDIAGLFAFPFFFSIFAPRQKLRIYMATAMGFILWKLPAADAVIGAINHILPYSIGRVADYSDYWALLVLPIAYFYRPQRTLWDNKAFQAAVASIAVFAFCATAGTHGFIKFYRYHTSKYQLQQYINSVFANSPEFQVPKGDSLYDNSGPYFNCYLVDEYGPEVFIVRYYGDKSDWDKSPNECEIFITYAGGYNQHMSTDNDLSAEEKERLIKKFEDIFIASLNRYITPFLAEES